MNTHPILFSTSMVQAISESRKTMTRRIIKPQLPEETMVCWFDGAEWIVINSNKQCWNQELSCPYGQPGDILWVRETWQQRSDKALQMGFEKYYYKAGWDGCTDTAWKPSIYMPKSACRIFLKITDIRVQRLCEISEKDAKHEGCNSSLYPNSYNQFMHLWMAINKADSWNSNPWVWVISFERCEKPENFLTA
jgi:hypothetical protein